MNATEIMDSLEKLFNKHYNKLLQQEKERKEFHLLMKEEEKRLDPERNYTTRKKIKKKSLPREEIKRKKEEVIIKIKQGISDKELAKEYDFTINAIYKWRKQIENENKK